eukprot:7263679-Prymnesium_polylepis.1
MERQIDPVRAHSRTLHQRLRAARRSPGDGVRASPACVCARNTRKLAAGRCVCMISGTHTHLVVCGRRWRHAARHLARRVCEPARRASAQ